MSNVELTSTLIDSAGGATQAELDVVAAAAAAAQGTANTAVTNAATAQTTANTAVTNVSSLGLSALAGMYPIGCRGMGNYVGSSLSAQSAQTRTRHILPFGAKKIVLVYPGWKLIPAEAVVSDITAMHIGIEPVWGDQNSWILASTYAERCIKRATKSGVTDIALTSGGVILTDSIPISVASGGAIGHRVYTNSTSTFVLNCPLSSTLQEYGTKGAVSDLSVSGTYGTSSPNLYGYAPLAILGVAADGQRHPSVAIIGDSIDFGTISISGGTTSLDATDADGNSGWSARSLASQMPFTNFAAPGDGYKYTMTTANGGTGRQYRLAAIGSLGFTHVILKLGTNDTGTMTTAQIQNCFIAQVKELQSLGLKVIAVTPPPKVASSSDGFVSNQVTDSGSTQIRDYAIWLRANAVATYGCDRLIDLNLLLRDPGNDLQWNLALSSQLGGVPPTYDGVHFSQALTSWITSQAVLTPSMITL
jgi:lysophospholipase L1-like esterase